MFLLFLFSNQGYTQLFKKNLISLLNSREALIKAKNLLTKYLVSSKYYVSMHCMKSFCIGSFSSQHFPAFGVNTERYSVFLHVHPDAGKCRPEKLRIWTLFTDRWALFLLQKYYLFWFILNLFILENKRWPVFSIDIADSIIIWLLISSFVSGRLKSILNVKFAGRLLSFLVGQCGELHVKKYLLSKHCLNRINDNTLSLPSAIISSFTTLMRSSQHNNQQYFASL